MPALSEHCFRDKFEKRCRKLSVYKFRCRVASPVPKKKRKKGKQECDTERGDRHPSPPPPSLVRVRNKLAFILARVVA